MKYVNISGGHLWLLYLCPLLLLVVCNDERLLNEWAVQIKGGVSTAKAIARRQGFIYKERVDGLEDIYVFSRSQKLLPQSHIYHTKRLKRSTEVLWAEQQVAKKRRRRTSEPYFKHFNDPAYDSQWYLTRASKHEGADMNIQEAWSLGFTGKGVVSTILDDGIEYTHPDLAINYDAKASTDINDNDADPMPKYDATMFNKHGTRCAGVIAAVSNNQNCGVGVAYNSKIGGVRMLDGDITDVVESKSIIFNQAHIDIYSGSWGPEDNGQKMEGPGTLAKAAFLRGAQFGRNELGNIFVWASGNGGRNEDTCATDGYAGSLFTFSVGSVSEKNVRPWYLEECASTLVSTYSSGNSVERKVVTTDLNHRCTDQHTGTSASAPMAAGIIALALEANPKLTWRDVQYIALLTANPDPIKDGNFITNGMGKKVSLLYGYGLMDAGKMVRLAELWVTLPPQHSCRVKAAPFSTSMRENFDYKVSVFSHACSESKSPINFVEHVQLLVGITYGRRGDIRIYLVSPQGTRSLMLPARPRDNAGGRLPLDQLPLMSVQFWGESALGEWIIEVDNLMGKSVFSGRFDSVALILHGTREQPIMLRQPLPERIPPQKWFQQFEKYVVSDATIRERKTEPCDYECLDSKCTGPGPQHCLQCKHLIDLSGICVSECPSSQYPSLNRSSCISCHTTCMSCKGPGPNNCSSCPEEHLLIDPDWQCIHALSCPEGYFREGNTCHRCLSPCTSCSSRYVCQRCHPDWVLLRTRRCAKVCSEGTYPDINKVCQPCYMSCEYCLGGSNLSCTGCRKEQYLVKSSDADKIGACVSKCPNGYFVDMDNRKCYRCSENCNTCTGRSEFNCTQCDTGYSLNIGKCLPVPISKNNNCENLDSNGNCVNESKWSIFGLVWSHLARMFSLLISVVFGI